MSYRSLCIAMVILFLSGCVDKSIIDDINIQSAVAIDQIEGDPEKIKGMILIQNYLPDQAVENIRFTSTGKIRRDLLLNIQKKSSQPIVVGGLMVTIFGDKISDYGIAEYVDVYMRESSVGTRNYLATSKSSAIGILAGEYGPRGNATYLRNLIEHNIEHRDVPKTNLHIFLRDYYSRGKDPYLPEINGVSKDEVEISGISLFKGDKEIDVLPKNKMFYFKLLVDNYSNGNFLVTLDKHKTAMVKSIKSKRKIKISKDHPNKVTFEIHINGVVTEYTGGKVTEKVSKEIEKELEKKVNDECMKLLTQFQEQQIDPIGIGLAYKANIRGTAKKGKNWIGEEYPTLSFDVKTKIDIRESGVIE
ncbi:spore germination protein [Cytobacillus eiseniae]|uniref:Spore germination protein n=1 Tax=Cytobacillus eiseniae TaxID=762947 RepID=A0ABS4RDJ0_9BACI|nr:Ger(x)C family spore germination protein [Cytobacillus eiseniae]MBP2240404.1 spore germination protein [Cytobacillus eiseniae]